ncbi:DNA glycosylase AlkZ-like family protein, partial [Microbacterium sp.]|uniref:DNA glycosylase AlkZ-like family protein n=1 Tax=Microbacterium sp. TaxID=51671 RepID=UPI003C706222
PTRAVVALPPFEEYYISYADRSAACPPERAATVGPGVNGLVKPILLAGGEIVGVWRHSLAAGKHHLEPEYELHMDAVDPASVDAALARYARFIRG